MKKTALLLLAFAIPATQDPATLRFHELNALLRAGDATQLRAYVEESCTPTYRDGAWTLVVLANVSGGAGPVIEAWNATIRRIA